MVPLPESPYFPSLDKCLTKQELLISWKTVFPSLLCQDSKAASNNHLESFFSDKQVQQLLAKPYEPFSFTQSNTKATFDTKTSAVNVAPNDKSGYNVNEIKEDSLWLSKEVQIDEISALRIAVLEFQTRPASKLQSSFSGEEAMSLQTAAGNVNSESTNVLALTLASSANALNNQPKDAQGQRRLRTVQIYLSERQNLLACSKIIHHAGFRQKDNSEGDGVQDASWVESVAGEFLSAQNERPERFLHYCVASLKSTFEKLDVGSGWFKSEGGREDIENQWLQGRITEAIHIMEIALVILDYRRDTRSPTNVHEWFQLMANFEFLDNFSHPDPAIQALISPLQALVSMVSVSMLDCRSTIAEIHDDEELLSESTGTVDKSYVNDNQTVLKLHEILLMAGSCKSAVASPSVLALSLILHNMEMCVEGRRAAHARAIDENDENYRPNTSGGSGPDDVGGCFAGIIDSILAGQHKNSPILHLADCVVADGFVFEVLSGLATTFGASPTADLRSIFEARIRITILDLIRASTQLTDYGADGISATLAALMGSASVWQQPSMITTKLIENPVSYFLQDPYLKDIFLATAASRYPYESLPFLKLMRAVSACGQGHDEGTPMAVAFLENLSTLMFTLPSDFREYQTTHEEENLNNIKLTEDIVLFTPKANLRLMHGRNGGLSTGHRQVFDEFSIPTGTPGRIVSEGNPKIAIWFHKFSGLKYLGKLLETGTTAAEFVSAISGESASQDELTEIISIFTTLLESSVRIIEVSGGVGDSNRSARKILELASDGLDGDCDIVSIIFSLFEEELARQAEASSQDSSLDLLNACVHFLRALVPVLPGRVWPLIGRSGLLDHEGRTGRLTTIISGVEFAIARYDFILSCTHLFTALVDDAAKHTVLRKAGVKVGKAAGNMEDLGTGLPSHVLSKSVASFTKTMLTVYESACNWRFDILDQRLLLSKHISGLFDKIIHLHFGVGDSPRQGLTLITALGSAANLIMDTFLSPTSGLLRFQPLFRGFLDGFAPADITVQTSSFTLQLEHVRSTLNFANSLIKLSSLVNRSGSQLEDQLFRVSPLIARLYAAHNSYQLPVTRLFESLVISASASIREPPSLLGHLGQETSKNFLSMLMELGKPLADSEVTNQIWRLFSAVVSNRQQWFAIYLLTGKKPRDNLKGTGNVESSGRPVIRIALDELVNIRTLPMPEALAILQFVSLAQNYWPWAMKDVSNLTDFITPLSNYVNSLEPLSATAPDARLIDGAYEARIAAYIAEIMAMYLYHERQLGSVAHVASVLTKLKYYQRCAVAVPSYNSSLHGNLKKNLEARYPGCSLQDFKHTRLENRTMGKHYFYNLDLANSMLRFHQAWRGKKGDGMTQELVKANINLSVVDSQISLLHGWKLLAIELSNSLTSPSDVKASVAAIATDAAGDCLASNTRSQHMEAIFTRLNQTRADLALSLIQKLSQTDGEAPKLKGLLPVAWKAIVNLETTFELAMEAGREGATYYRTLLKVLFLVLRVNCRVDAESQKKLGESIRPVSGASTAPLTIALDVLDKIVGQGFRDLASAIHGDSKSIVPDDIALITALLQTCLLIPGIESRTEQIQAILSTHETARMASALFSWSDKLAVDGDPIYGELSILFLLELSTIPEIAERLAVEGVLGHLSSAPLTIYMRKANVGPFSESIGAQRCYSIWARGILPLLLNLLARLEASIAGEIAIFLNQFPNLLEQAESALDMAPERRLGRIRQETRVSLLQISEIQSLALIVAIVKNCRTQMPGIPDIEFDSMHIMESVETWLSRRQVLSQRIVPLGVREAELARRSKLEGKVVDELEDLKVVLGELNEGN